MSANAVSHVLRADGGGAIGFGHIARCLSLADEIQARGGRPEIVLGSSDEDVIDRICETGHTCRQLAPEHAFDAACTLDGKARAIFDISHAANRTAIDQVARLFDDLRAVGTRTLLIDSLGDDCLAAKKSLNVDVLVIPYAGADEQRVMPGARRDARGPDFFVLDGSFLKPQPATDAASANRPLRVLITAGGSDPCELSLLFIDALGRVATPLELRIVIGPGFSEELTARIEDRIADTSHECQLVRSPSTLAGEMAKADIALSASGLTKYELAYTGTPAILVSIDELHAVANRSFAALGSCIDAGMAGETSARDIAAATDALIRDVAMRCRLAKAGRAAVDGKGTQRLVDMLDEYDA